MTSIEQYCQQIQDDLDSRGIHGEWDKRRTVAHAFGYEDAKFMAYMHETHGLSVEYQLQWIVEHGLKVPYTALRAEMIYTLGKSASSVDSLFKEMRFMEQILRSRSQTGVEVTQAGAV